MFFQLLYIHLFRPFLNYNQSTSPLPAHVSPRKLCTQAAQMISKLLRLYKRSHGLRQICNIAVYIAHSACTIHLLNLPDKNAKRDIIHGCKHLEEIAESWLCARRTLGILNILSRKWKVELPEEAAMVLARAEAKFGPYTSENSKANTPSAAPSPSQNNIATFTANSPAMIPNIPQTMYNPGSQASMLMKRRLSDPKVPPPISAAEMNAHRHLQTPHVNSGASPSTPNQVPQRGSVDSTGATNTAGGSPSELFTGVDALVRESQEWWLRDQSQLATGFENWNMPGLENEMWLNGGGDVALNNYMLMNNVLSSPPASTPNSAVAPPTSGAAGSTQVSGINGFGSAIVSYDDNDWYQ